MVVSRRKITAINVTDCAAVTTYKQSIALDRKAMQPSIRTSSTYNPKPEPRNGFRSSSQPPILDDILIIHTEITVGKKQ